MNSGEKAIEEAREAGFDLNLMDTILALSPDERVLRHEGVRELAEALRAAGVAFEMNGLTAKKLHEITAKTGRLKNDQNADRCS